MIVRSLLAALLLTVGLFNLYELIERPQTQVFGPTLTHGRGHVVALTFDDGPDPAVTPRLLDLLEREGVHATFFVVGRAVRAHPDLVRRMLADGNEIGNHTETHAHLNALFAQAGLDREIGQAEAAIVEATGMHPHYLRPPFGARNFSAIDAARKRGYTVVMWSDMLDDRTSDGAQRLLARIHDGDIVVLHDGDQGRDGTGGRTYEAGYTGELIAALRARGYRFVTISELEHAQA
ncbi:MAG: hypothetical protein NVSMB64_02190 [Candidatus Velthaea sp.]